MGIFSVLGSIFGGNAQKKAADKAAAAQIAAAKLGIDEQRRQYDQSRNDFMPYMAAGTSAVGGMSNILGLGGDDIQAKALASLESSPMFSSMVRNGEEAVLQNASATGGIRGGNTNRGLADFRADTFAQLIQQQLSNLGGIAGMGVGATGSVAGLGANKANAITGLEEAQGDALAMKYNVRGGVNANMWNKAGNMLDGKDAMALLGKLPGLAGGF